MRDLNIDFMDLYKRVDRFIKDAYSSSTGVSEYINQMELNFVNGTINILTWKDDYYQLKQMRWKRNQLAHEVGYDTNIIENEDYKWLEDFFERLMDYSDPMSNLSRFNNSYKMRSDTSMPKNTLPSMPKFEDQPVRIIKNLQQSNIYIPGKSKEELFEKKCNTDKKGFLSFIKYIKNVLFRK